MAGQTAELGTAYISVVPDTGGMAKGIKEALEQSEKNAPKSGNAIGQGLTAGINKTLKAGVVGVGVAAGGVLAGALTKGFGRLNALDQAESKLKGLGFSADEITRSMEGVNKSVKGTAFGLDEAAGSAAKLTGVGVAVGKELDRSLTLTADIAAQAGTSMDDISSIMAKIAGSGKLTGETLGQLEDRSTGAAGALADHLGVSIEEVRKQVSAGAIDFETFQAAMEGHIGGAAQKTGETFQGALDNMGSAMGRLGAKLLQPVFSSAPAVFGAIGGAFDTLGEKLEPLIEDFAEWLAPRMEDFAKNTVPKLVDGVMGAVDAFIEFGDWVKDNAEWIKPLAVGIGGAVAAIYAWNTATTIAKGVQAAFNTIVAANPIMLIVVAVAAVTAALVYFFTQTETGQRIWEQFTTALSDGWQWVQDKVGGGVDWLTEKFEKFTGWISDAWAGITSLFKGDFTSELREAFGVEEDSPVIRYFFDVRDAAMSVADGFRESWGKLKEGDISGAVSSAMAGVKEAAGKTWDTVVKYAKESWANLKLTGSDIWANVKTGASDVWDNVLVKAGEVTDKLKEKARDAFDWAKDNKITSGPVNAIAGIFDGIKGQWDELMPKLQPIKDAATDLWGVLTGKASEASGEAREGIAGMIDDFNTKVGELHEKIQPAKDAIKQIWDALHGRGGETEDAGAEAGGGIAGMVESITENIRKFRDETQPIIDKFKEKWDELKTAMEPLLDSVKDKLGKVAKTIGGATLAIALGLLLSPFIILAGAIYGALVAVNAIADGFAWVSKKWSEMKDSVETKWNELKANVFDAWERAVAWLQTRWEKVTESVSGAWTSLKDSVVSTWDTIKSSVFDAWERAVAWLQTRWDEITTSISGAWATLKDALVGAWNTIKSSVFDAWNSVVEGVKSTWERVTTAISDRWTWLKDQLNKVWSWIRTNVFDKIGEGLDTLKGWFQTGVEGIAKIWDGLKAAAAGPVRFVVDTVWNNGILEAWNTIAEFLPGIEARDKIPLGDLGRYATGGVLPGYTPGRDVHEFYSPTGGRIHLSGGEAIMRPEWTRAVGGPGAVERMNRDAKTGKLRNASGHGPSGLWDLGGFAGGGVIGAMMNVVRAKYGNILTMTSGLRPGGGLHGAGLATDWSNGGGNTPEQLALAHDIAQTYPGSAELIYDSPGWAGNIKNGQNVGPFGQFYTLAQAGRHDHHVHWGMTTPPTMQFGGGVFEGGSNGGGVGAAIVNWIADKARSIWASVVDPIKDKIGGKAGDWGDSSFAEIPMSMFTSLVDAAWSRLSSLFGSGGGSDSGSVDTSNVPGDVVGAVETVFARHGFTGAEWEAAKWIIQKESNWSPTAQNPSSGAYGLFQFNPMGGNTLGAYLPDRNTDPAVQADAGARYIKDRYGTPSAAKRFWEQNQWYADGGVIPSSVGLFDTGGVWKSGTMGLNLSGENEYVFTNRAMRDFQQATESLQVVAQEIGSAFSGDDWGYGELASYVGEDAAVIIMDAVSELGGYAYTIDGATDDIIAAYEGTAYSVDNLSHLIGGEAASTVMAAASEFGGYTSTIRGAVGDMQAAYEGHAFSADNLSHLVGDEAAFMILDAASQLGGTVKTFEGAAGEIRRAFTERDAAVEGEALGILVGADMANTILGGIQTVMGSGRFDFLFQGADVAGKAMDGLSRVMSGTFFDATEEVQKALSDLEAAREKAADGSDKIKQADENLVKAQKELQDALNGTADTSVSSSRKLEDAEEALSKARESAAEAASKEFKGEDAAKKRADAQAKAAEKVAAAEKRLERAREDASTQVERDAEKQADRVDKARQNLEKAEKGVADARKQSVKNADEVVAAEKRLAQVRANVTIGAVNDVIGGLQTVAGAVSRFAGRMRELAADAAATEEQLRGMRVENAALNIQRLQALLKLRQAENDLGVAREAAGKAGADSMKYLGDTSVAAIGDALVRFRETGVFSVEMVSGAAVDGANAVGEAHSAAADKAAEGNLQMELAAIEFAKASLAATHAVEMQSLVAEKLKDQTEQLYGLTEEQWGSVEKSTSGAGGFLGGLSKVAEAVMRGFVGFSQGGGIGALIGVLPVLGDAIGGLFDMFNGFGDVIDNIGDAFDAFLNMDLEGQIDTGLQFFTGLIPNILGWIAAALTGDASHIRTGREQAQNAADSANKHIDEKIDRRKQEIDDKYDQRIKDLQFKQDSEMAALTTKGQLLQLEFDFGDMWSAPEVQDIVSSIKASNEQQGTIVGHNVEAVGYQKQIAADVNAIAVKPDKKIEITLVGDATSNDRVESMLGQLGDQLGGVDMRVRRLESDSTQQVVDSRR